MAVLHNPPEVNDVAMSRDGIPIAYDVDGAGTPALVFVHGWSCDRTYWSAQTRAFADRRRVVAIDLAGHGESGVDRRAWTMAAFADDVAAVVDRIGLDDMVLVGHSMGGDVIVEAARILADRVRGLVWVDVYTSLGSPRSKAEIDAFVAPFADEFVASTQRLVRRMFLAGADPALVDRIADDMASAPPALAVELIRLAIANDGPILGRLSELQALGVPIVAINPDHRPTDEASLLRYGVRSVPLSGVGHFLMIEDPDRFNRVLGDVIMGFG